MLMMIIITIMIIMIKKTTTTTQYLSIQSIHAINNILKVTSYRSAKNKTIYNGNTNNTESHKLKYVTGL